jgi:hypothetical protein
VITSPSGERVYAARDGQPSTYEVEKSAVEEIRHAIQGVLKKEESAEQQGSEKAAKKE